jgi:hypothetical protein
VAKKKAEPKPATHFVVSRVNWRAAGWSRTFVRLPGAARIAAFADFDTAEADRAAREAAARKLVNPFRCGTTWAERSHLPELVFRDFIADAGVEPPNIVPVPDTDDEGQPLSRPERLRLRKEEPPAGSFRTWGAWWEARGSLLPAEHVARVWEGLDRVRFFSVEERPVRTIAFVVVVVQWNYNDEWNYPPQEGGAPYTAYRSRERAEAECERLNAEAREEWRAQLNLPEPGVVPDDMQGFEAFPFDMQNRVFPGDDPLGSRREPPVRGDDSERGKFAVDEVPFYEVIEVELPEGQ